MRNHFLAPDTSRLGAWPSIVVCTAALLSGWVLLSGRGIAGGSDGPNAAPTAAKSADEEAIRKVARDYEAACDAKDAKAVAVLFTPEGELVEDNGNVVQGRDAIAETFARLFGASRRANTKVTIDSIRFVAPSVAIEDGTTTTTLAPGQPPVLSRHCVTHVKVDGRWLMASARALESDNQSIPASERLKPLEFLIGDWVDESPESVVSSSYKWSEGHNFIDQKFAVRLNDSTVLHGTQRIGWDPQAKTIKSWLFDVDGGHAEGIWSWNGKRWIVKIMGTGADGSTDSATSAFTPVTKDSFDYESIHRIINGMPAPDVFAHVVRRPPQPHGK
jgi:uncharacterized protein (TIGR02246 family)